MSNDYTSGGQAALGAFAEAIYAYRRGAVVALLAVAAGLNLIDLASTYVALSKGFVETYTISSMVMGTTGMLGYGLAKVAFSLLLLWNARRFVNRLDRIGKKTSLVVLCLCFAAFAMYVAPVANNLYLLL